MRIEETHARSDILGAEHEAHFIVGFTREEYRVAKRDAELRGVDICEILRRRATSYLAGMASALANLHDPVKCDDSVTVGAEVTTSSSELPLLP